jgi:hypothetical protein
MQVFEGKDQCVWFSGLQRLGGGKSDRQFELVSAYETVTDTALHAV